MHTKAIGFAITGLLAPAIFGQEAPAQAMQDRLLRLSHTATVQEFQEIANLVRTITEMRDMSTDNAQMSLAVRGTAEQIGLAEWLVKDLDQPASAMPVPLEYKGLSDGTTAEIVYLPHASTVPEFQETVNAIRTVTEIRRVFTYNDGKAMVARGTPAQIAMAEWLVRELGQEQQKQSSGTTEYSVGDDDVMRVLYATNAKSVQDFQEIANAVRTTTEIRRLFTINAQRAVLIRSTADQKAMAQWLLRELDQPALDQQGGAQLSQASGEYRVPGAADDVMRVFHVANTKSVEDFQEIAKAVRTATDIRRVFTYNAQRAVAVRGTVNQLALAENLIQDLSR